MCRFVPLCMPGRLATLPDASLPQRFDLHETLCKTGSGVLWQGCCMPQGTKSRRLSQMPFLPEKRYDRLLYGNERRTV